MEAKITRKTFLQFFLLGGVVSLFKRKVSPAPKEKEALFWRKKNER